jgi:hypothetical protein
MWAYRPSLLQPDLKTTLLLAALIRATTGTRLARMEHSPVRLKYSIACYKPSQILPKFYQHKQFCTESHHKLLKVLKSGLSHYLLTFISLCELPINSHATRVNVVRSSCSKAQIYLYRKLWVERIERIPFINDFELTRLKLQVLLALIGPSKMTWNWDY